MQEIKKYFLSINLQMTWKALIGISGAGYQTIISCSSWWCNFKRILYYKQDTIAKFHFAYKVAKFVQSHTTSLLPRKKLQRLKLITVPAMYDIQLWIWQDVQLNGWLVHNPDTTQGTHHTDRNKIGSLHNCWLTVPSNIHWCLIISFC